MSRPIRPYGTQPTIPSGMIPTVGMTGPTPVVPHGYGMVTGQAHYVAHPSFPQNFPNIPNQIPVVPAMPGSVPMYVPVAAINPGMRPPTLDPSKMLEEQRRLEKERNFQMQQQRLKQFTIAGKKGNVNAESLIDSMFGKVQPKSCSMTSNVPANLTRSIPSEPPKLSFSASESIPVSSYNVNKAETFISAPVKQEKKDKKELEVMMRECSDFSGPQKANKFSKPVVKEVSPSTQLKYTFAASNKARDWSNLQGLDKVFVSRPRFPDWCKRETIPELYRKVETMVTNNGAHTPETKLLFPLLLSSGLPQQVLGKIWELVNQSAPGYLTIEEMYAALALIAVSQAGYQVMAVDILHQLPACPIPKLQCFEDPSTEASRSATEGKVVPPPEEPLNTHQVVRPNAITLKDAVYPAGNNSNAAGDFISSPDDEFDDFKSATPTAINFSIPTPNDDDFADFQQAQPAATAVPISMPVQTAIPGPSAPIGMPVQTATTATLPGPFIPAAPTGFPVQISTTAAIPGPFIPAAPNGKPVQAGTTIPAPFLPAASTAMPVQSAPSSTILGSLIPAAPTGMRVQTAATTSVPTAVSGDLMSPDEDKYSVFRSLQTNVEDGDWGDFSNAPPTSEPDQAPIGGIVQPTGGLFTQGGAKEDEFGDFLQAGEVAMPKDVNDFADFSNFGNPPPKADDFGDFASAPTPQSRPEPFFLARDNASLGETQSVSSLELGTFDGGGHSGESKSSLSRQGSIPSLDLKSTCIETAENDEFGEFQTQSFVQRGSKSPSPANDTKPPDTSNITSNGTSLGIPFQNSRTVPLADRYSVIRAEQKKEEDQHISCWVRCLQSSVSILQNTKKVFNQMSCSSVCNEVLQTEEGENYIRDVIEVYKVIRRISTASKSVGKQTIPILDLLKEADQAWNTISGFLAGSTLLPTESTLEFSNAVLSKDLEDNNRACGLCLLNVEAKMKSQSKTESLILSYGGRNYHSPCANLWVNCVDPLLPALTLPQLL